MHNTQLMLNSNGRSRALSQQVFCSVLEQTHSNGRFGVTESPSSGDCHRSQGHSEEQEKLLPQNRRIRLELVGHFSLSPRHCRCLLPVCSPPIFELPRRSLCKVRAALPKEKWMLLVVLCSHYCCLRRESVTSTSS